ncbi:MAG: biosynthetic peptidoglycan transglycosylase [Nannocystales bacterium]
MSALRPIIAAAALLAAPGPWLLETSLDETIESGLTRCADGTAACGALESLSLDAGGLRLEGLHVQRRGVSVRAGRAEVRPAWDGIDVHLDTLELARTATAPDATPAAGDVSSPAGGAETPSINTHGLTIRVQAKGVTALTEAGVTALLDSPALTIGPNGIPHASVGLTVQHARGSVHSVGRLRATPRDSLRSWRVAGTVSIADGPPLRLRGELDPQHVRTELSHEGGGWIQLAAWPQTRTLAVEAERFALHGLGRVGLQVRDELTLDARAASLSGRIEVEPARSGGVSMHAQGVTVEAVTLEHPKLSAEAVTLSSLWLDGDITAQSPEHFDAALTLGHAGLILGANASRRPDRAALRLELPEGPCQRLFDALPTGFADAMRGTKVDGSLAGVVEVSVDFEAARARAEVLERDPLAEPAAPGTLEVDFPFREQCAVTADPSALDVAGLRGPYRHRFVDAHGTPRQVLIADGAPHTVSIEDIPVVAGAFVTLEDSRYFHHDGLDLGQVANAIWHNLARGEVERGASTITQQAARNLFLGLDRTAARKLQEAFVATRIDATVEKRRLLEVYLNIIELAPGVHGVEDAAQYYFNRSAADLTALQATHLAMLAPAPRTYSERFVSGAVDDTWRQDLNHQVRRLARHRVIDRHRMIGALRGDLELVDRR